MAEIRAKASLDSRKFQGGVNKMKKSTSGFGKTLKGIGGKIAAAFAVKALITFVKSLIDFGSELTDFSEQTGVALETLQKLQGVTREAGAQNKSLINGLTRLRDAQGAVIEGDQILIKAFKDLGISEEEVASKNIDELFISIGKALKDSGTDAAEFSALVDLIGTKNAAKLLEAFKLASGGVDQFGEGVKIMSDETAQRLDKIADRFVEFKNTVKVVMAEALISVIDFFSFKSQAEKQATAQSRATAAANKKETEDLVKQTNLAKIAKRKADEAGKAKAKEIEKEARLKERAETAGLTARKSVSIATDAITKAGGAVGGIGAEQALTRKMLTIQLADLKASQAILAVLKKQKGIPA